MHPEYSVSSSLTVSGIVCVGLMGIGFLVWKYINIPPAFLPILFVGAVLFSFALITVVVYQSLRMYASAHSIARDITSEILTYSRELFSELYRNSPVPYILIDKTGIIESVNFSAARLFSIEIQKFEGVDVFTLIEGEDEQKIALIPEYFKQGRFVNDVEAIVHEMDGKVHWVMLSLFSFRDTNNDLKGLMTLVDITKQKQIDKAKTEFVSLASHQLRTPVSAMRWNLELLATATGTQLSELQQSYVQKISRGLERMQTLVDDFLNVSKLELGTLSIQRSTFDLTQFFGLVVEEYRAYAATRGVEVETNWNEPFGTFSSDSHLLNMAVSNILGNAIKYTPVGGKVRAYAFLDEKTLTIAIADNGIGIPEEDQEMIFSKLFRASNAHSHESDGTGLGLYIVKEAIRILGGTITFESKQGVGTTFTVILPT
ncbi:PAS domain-containing sensor histidine kinase [Candidatus Kaiserbacteria bacterium]|nr:MAG: PAS domain-containing sensor histidine kinase [Candidatus Kaiserbacteria bacterium]